MQTTQQPTIQHPSASVLAGLLGYLALICYGSLYPFHDWRLPQGEWWSFLLAPPPRFITRTDVATNVLVYVPLGMLIGALLAPYMRIRTATLWALAGGLFISFTMELLQLFVPNRVASNVDILTNGMGALFGGLLFRIAQNHRWPGRILLGWRERWFIAGRLADLGLFLLALWVLSQLSLDLPSLLAGSLHKGFTPYWETITDLSRLHPEGAIIYALEIVSLGLFTRILVKPGHRMLAVVVGVLAGAIATKFVAAAALVKLSVLSRLISLEVLAGLAMGLIALLVQMRRGSERRPYAVAIASLLALAAAKAWWVPTSSALATVSANAAERMLNITGLAGLVSTLWPYLAAMYLGGHWVQARQRTR